MHKLATSSAIALLALILLIPAARADLRIPQVPVSGTALQTFFNSQGQAINVNTDQQDVQQFAGLSITSPFQLTFNIHRMAGATSLDVYNTAVQASPLFLALPGSASPGWSAGVSFRTSPTRMVVNLFDGGGFFQGSNTYLGADPLAEGLAVEGAAGTHFSQDVRNTGGAAHLLFYRATGALSGSIWLCSEDQDGGSSDFADSIFLLESFGAVPVEHGTWGALKRRFH